MKKSIGVTALIATFITVMGQSLAHASDSAQLKAPKILPAVIEDQKPVESLSKVLEDGRADRSPGSAASASTAPKYKKLTLQSGQTSTVPKKDLITPEEFAPESQDN